MLIYGLRLRYGLEMWIRNYKYLVSSINSRGRSSSSSNTIIIIIVMILKLKI